MIFGSDVVLLSILITVSMHCIADFPLQGEYIAINKGKDHYILLVHCFIYTFMCDIGFWMCSNLYDYKAFEFFFHTTSVIFVSHILIDKFKCEIQKRVDADIDLTSEEKARFSRIFLYMDQFTHLSINFTLLRWMYVFSPFYNG